MFNDNKCHNFLFCMARKIECQGTICPRRPFYATGRGGIVSFDEGVKMNANNRIAPFSLCGQFRATVLKWFDQ